VLDFHTTIDEFIERNCVIAFVSTTSKHSLWQWQCLTCKYGRLGKVRVPVLNDQPPSEALLRHPARKNGMDLRGSYLIDPNGIVQQVIINNIRRWTLRT